MTNGYSNETRMKPTHPLWRAMEKHDAYLKKMEAQEAAERRRVAILEKIATAAFELSGMFIPNGIAPSGKKLYELVYGIQELKKELENGD